MIDLIRNLFKKRTLDVNDKKALGQYGETLAAEFLQKKHYKIVDRNWKFKNDELDIICLDSDILVFVEVKLRDSNALVSGYYSVLKQKKSALKRAIVAYLEKFGADVTTHRLDIIEITLNKTTMQHEILHFENISLN